MKIGMLAPVAYPIPPTTYSGIERIIETLANGLLDKGHEVTLFAPGDSTFRGRLVSYWPQSDPNLSRRLETIAYSKQLMLASQYDDKIELWSSHLSYMPLILSPHLRGPMVTTLHNRWSKEKEDLYSLAPKRAWFVSISDNQQSHFSKVQFAGTVYNGVDTQRLHLGKGEGGYYAWLGRFNHVKGAAEAIAIAKEHDLALKLAAPSHDLDAEDQEYFDTKVKPELGGKIEHIGPVDEDEKSVFLGEAKALLSPISWEEPFGLVPAEAMTCGTPVLTTSLGAMPELVVHGKTGFLAEKPMDLAGFLDQIEGLDRAAIREHAVTHFSNEAMIDGYERTYQEIINKTA